MPRGHAATGLTQPDSSVALQFAIASPTPRYAYIQSALPRVLVSTAHRTLQAVSLLAGEEEGEGGCVARCLPYKTCTRQHIDATALLAPEITAVAGVCHEFSRRSSLLLPAGWRGAPANRCTAHTTLRPCTLPADELALAFKANDAPLPPWRQLSSLLSKYNAARSAPAPSASFATAGQPVATQMGVGLAARGGAQPAQTQTTDTQDVPPGSAAEPLRLATRFPTQQQAAAAGTAGGAAAASARKAQQARQRVSCKLAQWGLQSAAAQLAAATDLAKASPPSVLLALDRWASGGSGVGSPAAAARPVHTLQIGFTVRECVCSGPAAATHRQRIQRPGQLMSRAQAGQLRAKGRAARAA